MLKYIFGGIGLTSIGIGFQPYIEAVQPYSLYFIFGGIFLFTVPLWLKLIKKVFADKLPHSSNDSPKEVAFNIKKKLEEVRERILLEVSKHPELEDNELAKRLSIGKDITAFHLEELKRSRCVTVDHIQSSAWKGTPYREEWSIDHLGRKYLIHHKLIK